MDGLIRVGVDIAKAPDRWANVVTEESVRDVEPTEADPRRRRESVFTVRFVERLPLHTPYPVGVDRVAGIVRRLEAERRGARIWLVLDSTGVGAAVTDLVRDALDSARFKISAATFTATDRVEGAYGSSTIRLGKAFMVSRLQVLLQTGRIKLPETPEARALARELADYELRVTDSASVQAGAFKTGTHDDLATALGLSVLDDGRHDRARLIGNGLAEANAGNWKQSLVGEFEGTRSEPGWSVDRPVRRRWSRSELVEISPDGTTWERRS